MLVPFGGPMLRLFRVAVYSAFALGANVVFAQDIDPSLLQGDMKKLVTHDTPLEISTQSFTTADGSEMTLQDYEGKYLVLNFWATWCAPCRKEMPSLAQLQEDFGGDDFAVVTLATGRNAPASIDAFFDEIGVTDLPKHRDPRQKVARDMAVLGLPMTMVITPKGQEIARLRGDADWASPEAYEIVSSLLGRGKN